jgi:hypothetical protein
MKLFIGPMSKNVVDTILEFVNTYDHEVVFIPSRRQIEHTGGYVNNWTTKEFYDYVQAKSSKKVYIERDHGGPGQGNTMDDGFASMDEDLKYMDILHIDPWKKYPDYKDGLEWTIKMIQYAYAKRPTIQFEVGTEEGIRPFQADELDRFVYDLKQYLTPEEFNQIKYLVIQCGTRLLETTNIGHFDSQQLVDMLAVCKKYNLTAKEHNGDWVTIETVAQKESLGLNCINIAPEFGEIETQIILNTIRNTKDDFDSFYKVCRDSGKWKKWVSPLFVPDENKEKLIQICGHYNFMTPECTALKQKYPNLDAQIKKAILRRLFELHRIFIERKSCIFCKTTNLIDCIPEEKETPICYSLFPTIQQSYILPYGVQYCKACDICQIKYLGDIAQVYKVNHIDNFGAVKHDMHATFASFISQNPKIQGSLEIGACHDYLSRLLLDKYPGLEITIVDPSFTGDSNGLHVISDYIENIALDKLNCNTIVMSSVFEHFYEPLVILEQLQNARNIDYIYLNHPNMEYALENDVHINLTAEHTFYIKNNDVERMFAKYGFKLQRKEYFQHHTICLEFVRSEEAYDLEFPVTNKTGNDIQAYIRRIQRRVDAIHALLDSRTFDEIYLWPASMHTVPLFIYGLDPKRIKGFVDNSPNKIGKYFYGYNLKCYSFKDSIETSSESTCILLGGAENYKRELQLSNFKGTLFHI